MKAYKEQEYKTYSTKNELINVWSQSKYGKELSHTEWEIFPKFLEIAKQSDKILEVGSGNGRMIGILKENGVKSQFYAMDLTENVRHSLGNHIISDARDLPFKDNSFDLVYSLGVIEHFPETFKAIQEQARIAKRGGKVLLTVPRLGFDAILRYIYYFKSGIYKLGSYQTVKGRNMRISQIKTYVQKAGLKIVELRPVGYAVWITPSFTIEKQIEKILPSKYFGSFIYCLAEKVN